MKLPTLSSRFWVALSTLAIIAALFGYYLLVYVNVREEKLRVDKYRALARYGDNMIQTRKDYDKALERLQPRSESIRKNAIDKYFDSTKNKTLRKDIDAFLRTKNQAADVSQSTQDKEQCCCCHVRDTVKKGAPAPQTQLNKNDSTQLFWGLKRDTVRRLINELVHAGLKDITYDGYLSFTVFDSLQHYNFDKIYFSFPTNRADRLFVYNIATKDFVYRPRQFDEFFIVKDFERMSHEHGNTLIAANETFQTFQNRINLQNVDSLLVREKGLLTSHFGEVKFADTRYELFVHSITFSKGENWLLCGLIEKGNYNYAIRAVSPLVITAAVLILLFLIVAMPILKPLIMNRFERLGFVNVWLAGFSIAYGGALFFLLIWSSSHTFQSNDIEDNKLKTLSDKVKDRFESELCDIYQHLDAVRTEISPHLIDTFDLKKRYNVLYGNLYVKKVAPNLQRLLKEHPVEIHPYFSYLLWIDSLGIPKVTITSRDMPPNSPMPDLKGRRYFSRARNDSLWNVPGKDGNADPSKRFALQSIQSWTTHQPEAGFGIVFDTTDKSPFKVLAMSTRLSSVMDPALPSGFGFCIIDDAGEVWFHSNTKKNHQENIFLEVEHHGKLTSAVKGRAATLFSAEYDGELARMYVQPLTDIPLHLVVFHDKNYQATPVVLTIVFAFAFLVLIIIVQVVQLLLLYACEYRSRKLKRQGYFLRILRPRKGCAEMYRTSIAAQSTLLVICFALYWFNYFVMIVGLITLPIMLMVFHQILYKDGLKDKTVHFAIASLGFILILNLAISKLLEGQEVWFAVGEQFVFAIVLTLFILLRDQKPMSQENLTHKFPQNYYAFLSLLFFLTSIFPVTFFYKVAYWEETLLWNKFQQLEARESAIVRERMLDTSFDFLRERPHFLASARFPGNYLEAPDTLQHKETTWGNKFEEILFRVWPQLPHPVGISSAAVFNKAMDEKWTWRKSRDEVEITYKEKKGSKLVDVHYKAPVTTFNPFAGGYGFWMFLLAVLSLCLLYRVIKFCVKYFFGVGLIPEYQPPSMESLLPTLPEHRNIYITQLPGCPQTKFDAIEQLSTIRFVRLFEQGINDHASNQKELAYMTQLTRRQNPPIVVVAPVQPNAIVEVYRKWLNDARTKKAGQKPDEKDNEKTNEYEIALHLWSRVFRDFEVYYLSITPEKKKKFSSEMMKAEMNASVYLQNLAEKMKHNTLPEDDFVINVEEVAEPYYTSLWDSFSPDEKLLLFDLAQDRFANMKNHRTLRILMQKGVIINTDEDGLGIMNKSFSNFIINVFRNDEEVKLTQSAQAQGSWHTIQLVLVLVLAGIVTFIALAQKEFFGNINAVIVAATGALALFSKFGGLFGSGSKAKE